MLRELMHNIHSILRGCSEFEVCFHETDISSVESQKDVIADQRCSIENQKGVIAVQSLWQ